MYDITGDYDVAFYVAGAAILIAGVICLPLRIFRRCIRNKENSDTTLTEDELALVAQSIQRNKMGRSLQQSMPSIQQTLTNDIIETRHTRSADKLHTEKDRVENSEWVI